MKEQTTTAPKAPIFQVSVGGGHVDVQLQLSKRLSLQQAKTLLWWALSLGGAFVAGHTHAANLVQMGLSAVFGHTPAP